MDLHNLTPHMRPAGSVDYLSLGIYPIETRISIRLQHPLEVL
jgi:hypothetical protein